MSGRARATRADRGRHGGSRWNPTASRSRVRGLTSQSDGSAELATIDRALAEGRVEDAARAALAVKGRFAPETGIGLLRDVHRRLTGRSATLRAAIGQALVDQLVRRDEVVEALAVQEQVLADAQEAGDAPATVSAEATGALIAWRLGDREAGRLLFAAASRRASLVGPPTTAIVLAMRARVELDEDEPEVAAALLREAIDLHGEAGDAGELSWWHALLAQALVLANRPKDAARALLAALGTTPGPVELALLAACLDIVASLAWDVGSHDEAAVAMASADAFRSRLGTPRRAREEHLVAAVRGAARNALAVSAPEAATRARAALQPVSG